MNPRVRKRGSLVREKEGFELNWAMYNYSDFRVTRKSKAQIAPFPIFRFPCWSHHVRYPYDASTNQMISDWSLRESDSFLRDISTNSDVLASHSRAPGRLAFSTSSGAGKRRTLYFNLFFNVFCDQSMTS